MDAKLRVEKKRNPKATAPKPNLPLDYTTHDHPVTEFPVTEFRGQSTDQPSDASACRIFSTERATEYIFFKTRTNFPSVYLNLLFFFVKYWVYRVLPSFFLQLLSGVFAEV